MSEIQPGDVVSLTIVPRKQPVTITGVVQAVLPGAATFARILVACDGWGENEVGQVRRRGRASTMQPYWRWCYPHELTVVGQEAA